MGLTFKVGLIFKVLLSKWGLLSREGLTIERAYYRAFTVCPFLEREKEKFIWLSAVLTRKCKRSNDSLKKVTYQALRPVKECNFLNLR